jgi:hypothetical protein
MNKNGGFLHQLLAVSTDLDQQARAIMEETVNTFTKKAEHFDGIKKVYSPYDDAGEKLPPEIKEVVTTVGEKLSYAKESVIKAMDVTLSKEETNSSGEAKAELIVDGLSFGTFSATSFIALERYLEKIRDEYKAIPTLDPTRRWTKETSSGRDLREAIEVKYRSEKKARPLVLSPATMQHPAQVQLVTDEIQVGKYDTTYSSGRMTPLEKSNLLAKLDTLIIEVKKAREIANQAKVKEVEIGEKIFNFIHT